MVTVGVLVRAELASVHDVEARLAALEGVTTLELEEPGSIGLVISEESLDSAYATLCDRVKTTDGVLAAYPLHTQLEPTSGPELKDEPTPEPQFKG